MSTITLPHPAAASAAAFTPRKSYSNRRLRPITRQQQAEFNAAVIALMAPHLTNPAEDEPNGWRRVWLVLTDFGWLHVTLFTREEAGGSYFSIATCFQGTKEELARAAERIGRENLNHYSGKWNVLMSDAECAVDELAYQLKKAGARVATLATLTPEEYSAPGGPGCAEMVARHTGQLRGLKALADAGDKLAARDYAAQSDVNSYLRTADWSYRRGEISDEMRFDMSQNWREHVRIAIQARQPVSAAVDRYGIELPAGYVLEGDRYVCVPAGACCANENRSMAGGCLNCGDPSF
jgi:hypothetical protein